MMSNMGAKSAANSLNEADLFCLKWSNFQRSVSSEFKKIQEDEELVDITFACDGGMFGAHKLVLFACSPYLKNILKVSDECVGVCVYARVGVEWGYVF